MPSPESQPSQSQPQTYTRREFFHIAGLGLAGAALAGCTPSEPTPPPKIFGPPESQQTRKPTERLIQTPTALASSLYERYDNDPEFRNLQDRVHTIESQWSNSDLTGNPRLRTSHLDVCAELFAKYSDTTATKDTIVKSVQFLPREQFNALASGASTAAALTQNHTLDVYISEQAFLYNQTEMQTHKTRAPWFSPLSRMRMLLFHELFHREGMKDPQHTTTDFTGVKREKKPNYRLAREQAFVQIYKPNELVAGPDIADMTFEEAYATNMSNWLSQIVDRLNLRAVLSGSTPDERRINVMDDALVKLFKQQPQWRKTMQECHDNSLLGLNGFARFLANHDKTMINKTEVEKNIHGINILYSMQEEDKGVLFNQYLSRIQK